ncbi:POU domain, class 4, transcription factor 2-like [Stegodyphus dumicola]|uniref:POU domain, class 4, transcription factor 2-like n=1 Tax=Stegodyphus dumicola TaxID=202533 RepID=UPI0015ABE8A4|nr:POU domain, class 4, transcription factor 2-like [Stegodyphus dumicola]
MFHRKALMIVVFLIFLSVFSLPVETEGSIYKKMAEAMMHHMMSGWSDGWQSKGITLGLKSKGMTAIIPIPLPVPVFTKDKGGGGGGGGGGKGGGGGGGEKIKYIPIPVPAGGGKESDWWR